MMENDVTRYFKGNLAALVINKKVKYYHRQTGDWKDVTYKISRPG